MSTGIKELWLYACIGDTEKLKEYYTNGGKINLRYDKFGIRHSLIAGVYRNGNYETVRYLYEIGETPEEYEKDELNFSNYVVVVIKSGGKSERIGFNAEDNARKIYRHMCEIALRRVENITEVQLERCCRIIERVKY